jgi:GDP-D-mannose 3',5'-epimerase
MANQKLKVLVAGGGGFIGSHVARRLKQQGHWVRIADWKNNSYFPLNEICDEFCEVDLRDLSNCERVCAGIDHVYDFAADMGGMGFIQSNHSVILYNNIMIRLLRKK